MKYIETNSLNPYYNLAFEEYILNNCKSDDYLLLCKTTIRSSLVCIKILLKRSI